MFALAVGLFFAVPLFTLVFSRLVFEPPMPDVLKPSLLILATPFAVAYSGYTVTAGQTDLFGDARHADAVGVRRAAWATPSSAGMLPVSRVLGAVSFPLAASSIAAPRSATTQPGLVTDTIALVLLALATLVIAALLGRTVLGLFKGELRTLSR